MDGCHFIPGGFLNTRDSIGELFCGMEDATCCDGVWDRIHMVLETECVGDAFNSSVPHDDLNTAIMIGGMGEVPYLCSMVAP